MNYSSHTARGFTLMELMIVVAIIAILAAIAIPTYERYIRMSRVKEATSVMLDNVKMMERYYANASSFKCEAQQASKIGATCQSADEIQAIVPDIKDSVIGNYYTFNIKVAEKSDKTKDYDHFFITAAPNETKYPDRTLSSEQLYVIYRSENNIFVECTREGYTDSLANKDQVSGCKIS